MLATIGVTLYNRPIKAKSCCCRFDMFNVKMQKVKFEPINGRSYNLYSMSDKCADKRRYPYRSDLRPAS